jgi:hypothetical protein
VPDSIITGEPNEFVREIRARMPVFLPEEHHDRYRVKPERGSGPFADRPEGSCEDTMESAAERNELVPLPIYSELRAFPSVHFKNISICKKCCKTEKMQ